MVKQYKKWSNPIQALFYKKIASVSWFGGTAALILTILIMVLASEHFLTYLKLLTFNLNNATFTPEYNLVFILASLYISLEVMSIFVRWGCELAMWIYNLDNNMKEEINSKRLT